MKKYNMGAAALAACILLTACHLADSAEESEPVHSVAEEQAETKEESEVPAIEEATQDIFAMDTYMTVTAYGVRAEEAVEAAVEEIRRLDALLSTGDENSETGMINANGGGILSEDTAYLLSRSLELYEKTGGVFDIAIYPVMEAWGFPTGEFTVPSEETLNGLLEICDAGDILYDADKDSVSFAKEGMAIDFGGIAKGYTSLRLTDIFREYDISTAMINLGGNVQVHGTKTDGSLWRVGIEHPDKDGSLLGILETADTAVITSGGYERYFEEDGVTYHHIIDPETGYPAENGLVSVSVVSADGTLADALSTSLFIMGLEKAEDFWRQYRDEFDVIMLTEANEVYISEGIADSFTSDLPVHVFGMEE